MRYKISKNKTGRISLPPLIGGINNGKDGTDIEDNQLSDAVNVIALEGSLRTRPAFIASDSSTAVLQSNAKKVKRYDITFNDGSKLISVWEEDGISFYKCHGGGTVTQYGRIHTGHTIVNEWTADHGGTLYSFVTYNDGESNVYKIYKDFAELDEEEIYAPIISINAKSDASLIPDINGDGIEGYNLLGDTYRIQWTAFNLQADSGKPHWARYSIPHKAPAGSTVKVDIILDSGDEENYEVNIGEDKGWYYSSVLNGKCVGISGKMVYLFDESKKQLYVCSDYPKDENGAEIRNGYFRNNVKSGITITAEYELSEEENAYKEAIFSATTAQWFGGGRGLASGTRLFIGGMKGDYRNILQWSDLSKPLYFPADCNSEVGERTDGITQIGKQSDMLVIFKEREIFYASYSAGNIEDVSSSAATDLTVSAAVFPLTQIPSTAGCDCPDTVQLCANRLVWANSNGKVYTLVNSSQYNEKNIYELSGPVSAALRSFTAQEFKAASSCEYEGYYVLAIGKHLFFMDYTSYGYRYIYSYKNEEAAESKLPWFYLSAPAEFSTAFASDGNLCGISVSENRGFICYCADKYVYRDNVAYFTGEEFKFTEQKIYTMLQSKIFDFGYPDYYKRICEIFTEIGNSEGDSVRISFVTDKSRVIHYVKETEKVGDELLIRLEQESEGEGGRYISPRIGHSEMELNIKLSQDNHQSVLIQLPEVSSAAPGYFTMMRFNPQLSFIRRFAVKLECEGVFSLGSISINYRMLGSVK